MADIIEEKDPEALVKVKFDPKEQFTTENGRSKNTLGKFENGTLYSD